MNNNELDKIITKLIKQLDETQSNDQGWCILDPQNSKRFMTLCEYCKELIEEHEGRLECCQCKQDSFQANVAIIVPLIHMFDEHITQFAEIMKNADVCEISPHNQGIYIEFAVNYVWRKVYNE